MKNIHVLPTEKPSRLHEYSNIPFLGLSKEALNWKEALHIYITSDEEIKEGYAFHLKTQEVLKLKGVGEKSKEIFHSKGFSYQEECKKIILTTDQALIKDGVQAIDDDFIEWFVKNSSCEEVKVTKIQYNPVFDEDDLSYDGMTAYYNYKIIIPKEEAKQEGYICPHTKLQCDDECCVSASDCHIKTTIGIISEPKQETLEEAAREYYKIGQLGFEKAADTERAFLRGGLWQQEQDNNKYSEEDMLKILHKFGFDYTYNYKGEKTIYEWIPEWFQEYKRLEQLKNK